MQTIDKSLVRAAFDRAAHHYDALAAFQHQVCDRLAAMLAGPPGRPPAGLEPLRLLDGGCGTGYGARLLRQQWPDALLVGCDLAAEMARKARLRGELAVCADLECLPFADGSFDLVWSSLALQWCQPQRVYAELQRVLVPGGLLAFSTLVPGTLQELEAAFSGIDAHRRVLPLASRQQVETALVGAGFDHLRLETENWVTRHPDFKTLLATIRGIGANQIGSNRRPGLMGKTAWQVAQARYESLRDADGQLPATYIVLLGMAQKPG